MQRLAWLILLLLAACGGPAEPVAPAAPTEKKAATEKEPELFETPKTPFAPRVYACARTPGAIVMDGKLDDDAWEAAALSHAFRDIRGGDHPTPRFETRVRMLWDDEHLYIGAWLEEPHLQATFEKRDSYIFHQDNDFEVFVDPDGDTHDYYELEINAKGTEWDLFLDKPYRDGGQARDDFNLEGLETAIHLDGTLNDPSDTDRSWSLEIRIPWKAFGENAGLPLPPKEGGRWRINFSRVQWQFDATSDGYTKTIDPKTGEHFPEDNWVWSPQGLISMHYPERWGVLMLLPDGVDAKAAVPALLPAELAAGTLREIYYAQQNNHAKHERYALSLGDLKRLDPKKMKGLSMEATPLTWLAWTHLEDGPKLAIHPDGRVAPWVSKPRASPMQTLDWSILVGVLLVLIAGVLLTKKHMRSVADFLAAGRTGGRYLVTVSSGMAALGAITIIANLQMNFEAGFAMAWWGLSMGLIATILAVTGWVTYRFRATRSLTLAEFFERRYSRNFRVFAGLVAFGAGLVNFGIFPAVGARFFIYFVGLPDHLEVLGFAVGTYPLLMFLLLAIALYFVFAGGQVAVMITDFIQGLFSNIVFLVIPLYLLLVVGWPTVMEVLGDRPPGKSLIDPFDTGYVEDFNFTYFLIGVAIMIYGAMSWQGTQGYNTSARSAHEAKMGGVLTMWRGIPQGLLMLLVPILAVTVMSHPEWTGTADGVVSSLAEIDNDAVRSQVRSPMVLAYLLPTGLIGLFAAMMLAAFISTHDTYLHSWGSIFIQDVVMPFRKKPFEPKQHLSVLRWAILGVAVFIFFFSLLFEQTQAVLMYFAITGAIFAGGSGAVIIGGLYWKRGTTGAAWTALITGATLACGGLIVEKHWLAWFGVKFPLNGQEMMALAMGTSIALYVLVSLLVRPRVFDLDRLLHRGKYALKEEYQVRSAQPSRGWRMLGMGREFALRDRVLYILTYVWTALWTITFIIGTVFCLTHDVSADPWIRYWEIFIWVQIVMSAVVIVWFSIGGFRDARRMIQDLSTMERDPTDDGMVRHEPDDDGASR